MVKGANSLHALRVSLWAPVGLNFTRRSPSKDKFLCFKNDRVVKIKLAGTQACGADPKASYPWQTQGLAERAVQPALDLIEAAITSVRHRKN